MTTALPIEYSIPLLNDNEKLSISHIPGVTNISNIKKKKKILWCQL